MGILDGKVAIVTGAGSGIGEGEAYALAKEGAKLVVVARTQEKIERVASQIRGFGGEALAIPCDVTQREDVDNVVAKTIEAYGKIDILVNNAQRFPLRGRKIENWTEQDQRDMWESGYLGSWMFMVACLPHMKERGGRIINTGSAVPHGNFTGLSGYGAAKEAIRMLTQDAAKEWGRYNINVNVINPSAPNGQLLEMFKTEEERKALLAAKGSVLGRLGDPEVDIGRTVVFLAGPDSAMITGCTISADGGYGMI